MARRKRKRPDTAASGQPGQRSGRPALDLHRVRDQVQSLVDAGRLDEAIEMLENLLPAHPDSADLHFFLGYACFEAGDVWRALDAYEQGAKLGRGAQYWLPLGMLYSMVEFNQHALHALRQMLKYGEEVPERDRAVRTVAELEAEMQALAERLGISVEKAERGLRFLEDGIRSLHAGDLAGAIAANRRAVQLLRDWPPPYNNLSLALFRNGQPDEALAATRRVLAHAPDNIPALNNAIRYLAWTGQEAEARETWGRLRELTPEGTTDRFNMAEAAAVLGQDEDVYRLLKLVEDKHLKELRAPGLADGIQWFLAVAAANTGRREARRRLAALQEDHPRAGEFVAALKAGRPGPAHADRFPYFHSSEMITPQAMQEFIRLLNYEEELPAGRFRQQMDRFVARYPQIVRVCEKLIWEENQEEAGAGLLLTFGTPEAYAALRRFGLSQVGEDEARMRALFGLVEAGEISPDEQVRIWSGGQWREVQLRQYEVYEDEESSYAPRVQELLDRGLEAFQREDLDRAERLFRQVLEMEPRAKEAYNNLGVIYSRHNDAAQAKAMYHKAVEIDPAYVLPRCNLVVFELDEDNVEAARDLLKPVEDLRRLRPQESAFYTYLQARLAILDDDYEGARRMLESVLKLYPDYEVARDLLERLEMTERLKTGFDSFWARLRQRGCAKRLRMRDALATSAPRLVRALGVFTKVGLTAMARVVLPEGGWSALRKAELLEAVADALQDRPNLAWVVDELSQQEQEALREVLAGGGSMPWEAFDARYGNDLEESPDWEYHQPETLMGRLRLRGLLAEAKVNGGHLVAVPVELREILEQILAQA